MIKQRCALAIVLLGVLFGVISCSNDNDTDSSSQLYFSTDKLDLTTVFATDAGEKPVGSITGSFMIYNRSGKGDVNISSIELMNPDKSGFMINVDGVSGTHFQNVEVLKKDSLYVFVQINPPATGSNKPVVINDSIRFMTNGHVQYVKLEALGQDVYVWKGKIIDSNTTLATDKGYLISDSLVVASGATLTVPAGVDFFFRRNALLSVHGNVNMQGTVAKPISLRGDRFDNMTVNIPYNNVSGQWGGVIVHENSFNNIFENVKIRSSIEGITFYSSDVSRPKASLLNVSVENTSGSGLVAINSDITATNCLFANSAGPALMVIGGKYDFTYCTVANYYAQGTRRNRALYISNYDGDSLYPLAQCNIVNTIVYGSVDREYTLDENQSSQFQYQFTNCLIKGDVISTSQFDNCLWSLNPEFVDVDSKGIYDYNFRLKSNSPAIDKAKIIPSITTDIDGNSRSSSASDIGCYEWH